MRLQVDGQNLTNVVDVINFAGLFSGNAIGPSRSVSLRLTTNFRAGGSRIQEASSFARRKELLR
jgi:hypothetical protein